MYQQVQNPVIAVTCILVAYIAYVYTTLPRKVPTIRVTKYVT
jgi:hypothetical protein